MLETAYCLALAECIFVKKLDGGHSIIFVNCLVLTFLGSWRRALASCKYYRGVVVIITTKALQKYH